MFVFVLKCLCPNNNYDNQEVLIMAIPNDPVMLLSFVNLKLRDYYPSLDEMCSDMEIDKSDIISKLSSIDYEYDKDLNKFV